jgi:hypothetical protein
MVQELLNIEQICQRKIKKKLNINILGKLGQDPDAIGKPLMN